MHGTGNVFTYASKLRLGDIQFFQDCILNVDVGRVLEGTEVETIQVLGNSMTMVVDGERIRFKVEFVEQPETFSTSVE